MKEKRHYQISAARGSIFFRLIFSDVISESAMVPVQEALELITHVKEYLTDRSLYL